jgi:uncharacterized protein YxeA
MKKIILIAVGLIVSIILYSLFTSENINSLEGDFQELAFIRNENNTGPVHRIYAYSLKDTLWSEMRKHAELLPHTKYGTTEVYYFKAEDFQKSILNLSMDGINKEAQSFCIGYAKIDGQSRVMFTEHPF